MFNINLERQLLKSNQRLLTPASLLKVREYDRLGEVVEDTTLRRLGLVESALEGKAISNRTQMLKQQTNIFAQERVFHVSQIKSVCNRYYLRFLPTQSYRGSIPNDLASRITNFETAYGIKCHSGDLRIAAPRNSFELEKRPKDPLLFWRINEEYYYLIHKWGHDLSVFRRLIPFFSSPFFFWLSIVAAAIGLAWFIGALANAVPTAIELATVLSAFFTVIFWVGAIAEYSSDGDLEFMPRWAPMNNWTSKYQ